MNQIKFGILGAGGIAQKMASTIAEMPEVMSYAVAARDLARAQEFADKFGIAKAYGSYEEMLADPELKLVYVATPHSHHYEHIKLCLEAGKNVLCEKAFTINAKQAEEVIAVAESKGLLLAEAIWTRYMPLSKKINELIAADAIGKVNSLTANLGYSISNIERIWNPALAGGALLDLGVYTLNFASMVLGKNIKVINSSSTYFDSGVDAQNSITIQFEEGPIAMLFSNALSETNREGIVYGDKGYMVIENINNPEMIRIYNLDYKLIEEYKAPAQITGFEYEVLACIKAIEAGKTECEDMPHAEIIRIMKLMDGLRAEWGVRYTELGE